MIEGLAVSYANDSLRAKAETLALRLQLPVDKEASHSLFLSNDKLSLKLGDFLPLAADFSAAHWLKRKAEGKKQGLVKACKPALGIKIIDATGGWGRDAAILASFGAEVILIERNPIMAALLADALARRSPEDAMCMRMSLVEADANLYLESVSEENWPDVIYMDPMHPEREKSALVKKDMQALQQLIGADKDALQLLMLAKQKAKKRVVVKWPQKQKPLAPPTSSIEGKTIRFDIYL